MEGNGEVRAKEYLFKDSSRQNNVFYMIYEDCKEIFVWFVSCSSLKFLLKGLLT